MTYSRPSHSPPGRQHSFSVPIGIAGRPMQPYRTHRSTSHSLNHLVAMTKARFWPVAPMASATAAKASSRPEDAVVRGPVSHLSRPYALGENDIYFCSKLSTGTG